MKWLMLPLNIAVILVAGRLICLGSCAPPVYLVLGVAVAHACYFFSLVTRDSVVEASAQYARHLMLSCELLMKPAQSPGRPGHLNPQRSDGTPSHASYRTF